MKKYGLMMLAFTAAIAAAVTLSPSLTKDKPQAEAHGETVSMVSEKPQSTDNGSAESIKMLDISSGEVLTLSMRDYLVGAVSAEMPASFEPEALKAQTVAAHTYAVRQSNMEKESPTPELCGAHLSNDSSRYQAYFTESQARQFYGTGYESANKKISAAVDEVLPYILVYEDEPILAAFCSMSPGATESAENVWGQAVPYLTATGSAADKNAPNFLETLYFSAAELKELLSKAFPEGDFSLSAKEWLVVESTSESGTVLEAEVGGFLTTGQEVRKALSLRSAAFEVKWEENLCSVTTKGYGHGVGMSQYGANAMAGSGADWREILMYYYKGAEITSNT